MKIKHLITTLALFLPLSLGACSNTTTNNESEEKLPKIVLSSTDVELVVGENYHLTIAYTDADMGEPTYYTSSNSAVVSVDDNGLVTAISAGEASVTVKKDGASATCNFKVSYATNVPVINVSGVKNTLDLDLTSTFTFDPYVNFAGMRYDLENPSITKEGGSGDLTINELEITPTSKGEVIIKIDGTFRDLELHPYYVSVNIKDSVVFVLTEEGNNPREYISVDLYSLASFNGKEYKNSFKPLLSLKINDVDYSSEVTFTLNNAEGVISYDEATNTITPIGSGKATLEAKYQEYVKSFPINVNYVYGGQYSSEPIVIDASIGEFPSEEIFAEFPGESEIKKATSVDGSVEYEVKNGKVLGIKSHNFAEQEILLYNNKIAYVVKIKAYAKIIRTPADLNVFIKDYGGSTDKIQASSDDGYYLLANDIDCAGINYPAQTRILGVGVGGVNSNCGFVGTFDGQGHTISNLKAPKGGLFLVVGNGAIIRNVGFKNAILDAQSDNDKFVLATYIFGASIENVYIESNSFINTVNNALVCGHASSLASFSNCVFVFTGSVVERVLLTHSYGVISHFAENSSVLRTTNFDNTYVLAAIPLAVCKDKYFVGAGYTSVPTFTDPHELFTVSAVKHYETADDFIAANNDFSKFDEKYWDYQSVPGMITWKF
jgi:hypothetical protein